MSENEKAAQVAVEALEACAKLGRKCWEMLAQKISDSEEEGEIYPFLQEIVDGEI